MNDFQLSLAVIMIVEAICLIVGSSTLWKKYRSGAAYLSAVCVTSGGMLLLVTAVAISHWSDTPTEFTPFQWAAIAGASINFAVCVLLISAGARRVGRQPIYTS